ncbi:cupin domain-containing protein [Flavimarina sp. Hel_I_48]|uniref:cupin domain-containing protein n=1 Tax=Flavimarina sp. Hel_I_48 TaxID=1392488 RepID=UPI0004DF1570|nr:cupin domain-containing protein [Flavimarina sp. Hel_I_48]
MIDNKAFFKDSESEWEYAAEGITRKFIGYNDQLMAVKVKFEKGAIGTVHNHVHTQGSYVASGRFKITIDGKNEILEAGDGFFVSPDLSHGAECLEAGVLIDVFNPKRKDFLNEN